VRTYYARLRTISTVKRERSSILTISIITSSGVSKLPVWLIIRLTVLLRSRRLVSLGDTWKTLSRDIIR
jgi:hypothetical protein